MQQQPFDDLVVAAARKGWARPAVGAIARATGLSEATIRSVFAQRPSVSRDAVRRVCEVLGVPTPPGATD